MLSVQTNMLAWNAGRQLNINTRKKAKASEKLASGYKINRAADDAAGLSISEKMRRQIRGLRQGEENITDGISWVQIGDGAMEEIAQMLHRMEELAVKAANGTMSAEDRYMINAEVSQLKKEINDISKKTVFNELPIFDNEHVEMDIEGNLDDLDVFDGSYDRDTGEVTYGGFLFRGNRVSWDMIDKDMVYFDKDTGEQLFKGGSYSYKDANGNKFQFHCNDGAKVPEITRTIDIAADGNGLYVDGSRISWSDLIDEDGRPASQKNCHDGTWYTEYCGATIAFFFPDGTINSLEDMGNAIDSSSDGKYKYTWVQNYAGSQEEKAVDVVRVNSLRISNALAQKITDNSFTCYVKADDDPDAPEGRNGIWLEDKDGNRLANSYRTWAEMGITSWFEGADIDQAYTYVYTGDDGNAATTDDTYLSFNYTLSDITSADSVIDGLDGMELSGNKIKTYYEMEIEIPMDKNILKASSSSSNAVTFEEEKALGRDFDSEKVDDVAKDHVEYDSATGEISLEFKDAGGNAVITYKGTIQDQKTILEGDLKTYGNFVTRRKIALAIGGKDPQKEKLGTGSLTELVGKSNITTDGYFGEVITIRDGMKLSDGAPGYPKGEAGSSYPAAKIDFKGLDDGTYTLDDLIATGFNSTCKTCSRHYSIIFTDGGSISQTAQNGYGYTRKENGMNYTLQIDISSLKDKGVTSAKDFTEAIVEITSECYDFHYTQYASDGSTLYVYDDRKQSSPAPAATFDTFPFNAIDADEFKFSMATDDGRRIGLNYGYYYGDFADNIVVEMKQNDSGGNYVKIDDGNGECHYELYDAGNPDHAGISERYEVSVSYQDMDGKSVGNQEEAEEKYADHALNKMFENSTIQLNACNYTQMGMGGNENANVAIRSLFDSRMLKEEIDNGIIIRCSAQDGDRVTIPRFGVNTFSLKLYKAGTRTQEEAEQTITITKNALSLLSERRSTYGAMQNRLEHTYNIRANAEENTQAAESRLRDADIAKEMLLFSNQNILMQAGVSMLAQANSSQDFLMQLLQ